LPYTPLFRSRIALKPITLCINFYMCWQFSFLDLGSDRSHDNGWAKPIPDIILQNEYRANAPLLRSDDRGQISEIHFAPLNNQMTTPRSQSALGCVPPPLQLGKLPKQ